MDRSHPGSIRGAVCYSSKDKNQLKKITNKININYDKKNTRIESCLKIRDQLLYLEKYSTGKNNMTYIVIPYNHPVYTFPFNLEDRIKYIEELFNKYQNSKVKFNYKKGGNGIFMNKRDKKFESYQVSFSYNSKLEPDTIKLLDKYLFIKKKNIWSALFE